MALFLRRKKKEQQGIDGKQLSELVQQELSRYMTREELQEYLAKIEKDKKKKQVWDSLSAQKKLKLLRYAQAKKGAEHGKK